MQVHEVRLVRLPHPSPAAVIAWPPHPASLSNGICRRWALRTFRSRWVNPFRGGQYFVIVVRLCDDWFSSFHFISTESINAVHSIQFSGHFSGCAEGPRGWGESRVFQQRRDGRCAGIEQFRLLRDHVKNVRWSGTYQYTFWWLFCWNVVGPGVQQL